VQKVKLKVLCVFWAVLLVAAVQAVEVYGGGLQPHSLLISALDMGISNFTSKLCIAQEIAPSANGVAKFFDTWGE
jgi:hypothetical protein